LLHLQDKNFGRLLMSKELEALILDLRGDILSLRKEIQDLRSQGLRTLKSSDIDTSAAGDADAGAGALGATDSDAGGAAIAVDRGSDVDQEN
jgi:hypothetical protein